MNFNFLILFLEGLSSEILFFYMRLSFYIITKIKTILHFVKIF
ncbi:hypothetical protein LEP1GSC025_4098 [Leptospira interrogans str. 2002000621]|nr:hypothetical protein LEP1GSC025_4098 [Leptospira interrogans str. 2002000621]